MTHNAFCRKEDMKAVSRKVQVPLIFVSAS